MRKVLDVFNKCYKQRLFSRQYRELKLKRKNLLHQKGMTKKLPYVKGNTSLGLSLDEGSDHMLKIKPSRDFQKNAPLQHSHTFGKSSNITFFLSSLDDGLERGGNIEGRCC